MAREFRAEDAEILGVSVDSLESHRKWAEELGGVDYPLLSDEDKTVSRLYGVLNEKEGVCLRATFIINPAGEISLSSHKSHQRGPQRRRNPARSESAAQRATLPIRLASR